MLSSHRIAGFFVAVLGFECRGVEPVLAEPAHQHRNLPMRHDHLLGSGGVDRLQQSRPISVIRQYETPIECAPTASPARDHLRRHVRQPGGGRHDDQPGRRQLLQRERAHDRVLPRRPASIPGGRSVEVRFRGITNPTTVSTNHTVTVSTTSDPGGVPSAGFTTTVPGQLTAVTVDNATPTRAAGGRTNYTVGFTLSAGGTLSGSANSRIYVTFPTGTTFAGMSGNPKWST